MDREEYSGAKGCAWNEAETKEKQRPEAHARGVQEDVRGMVSRRSEAPCGIVCCVGQGGQGPVVAVGKVVGPVREEVPRQALRKGARGLHSVVADDQFLVVPDEPVSERVERSDRREERHAGHEEEPGLAVPFHDVRW
jgi:hypothetical protein